MAGIILGLRSLTQSPFRIGFASNRWVLAGAIAMMVAQLAFTYLPPLHRVFGSAPISLAGRGRILAFGVAGYSNTDRFTRSKSQ